MLWRRSACGSGPSLCSRTGPTSAHGKSVSGWGSRRVRSDATSLVPAHAFGRFSMPDHDTSRDGDAELRRIAHALVAEAPPAPASLPILKPIPRRASWYGRRLVPAVAAAAVAVAAAGGLHLSTAGDAPKTADHSAASPPAQRLFLNGWPEEVLADGSVVEVPTDGIDRLGLDGMPQPLPGGRFVVLGVRDVSGSSGEAPVLALTVVNADGTVEMEREAQRAGGAVSLLAAVPNAAILGRYQGGGTRLVMHDLQSGQERLVAKTDLEVSNADVAGNRLAVVGPHASGPSPAGGRRLELIDWAAATARHTSCPQPARRREEYAYHPAASSPPSSTASWRRSRSRSCG